MFFAAPLRRPRLERQRRPASPTRPPLRSDAAERLILLGTAGASNPKATRAGYSNAIVVGDVAYLVDCGEGVHRQAWRSGISMHPERRPQGRQHRPVDLLHASAQRPRHRLHQSVVRVLADPAGRRVRAGRGRAADRPVSRPIESCRVLFPDAPTPGIRVLTRSCSRRSPTTSTCASPTKAAATSPPTCSSTRSASPTTTTRPTSISGSWPAVHRWPPLHRRWSPSRSTRSTTTACVSRPSSCSTRRCFRRWPIASTHRRDRSCSAATPDPATTSFGSRRAPTTSCTRSSISTSSPRRVAKLPNRDNIINHLTESHTSPEDAGRIAARAGVKTLVLSHLVPGDSEIAGRPTGRARARAEFAGNVVCGVDLDQFAFARTARLTSGGFAGTTP